MAKVCDIGKFKNYTVPPNCIQLSSSKIKRGFLATKVLEPNNVKHWSPVLILGNKRSGSHEAKPLLASFRKILNPAQVVELTEIPPEEALEWYRLVPNHVTCRVVAAGGDGTVCWIMNAIHKMKFKRDPEVAILPIGTGNDLSFALGFGCKLRKKFNAAKYLDQLDKATSTKLDRWQIQYFPPRNLLARASKVDLHMNNYIGIGVDAQVSLNFHRFRESASYIFNNRHFNKLMYLLYAMKASIKNIQKYVDLYMDGVRVELPKISAIVILNISTYAGGAQPWDIGSGGACAPKQDISDGLLEVMCFKSSVHMGLVYIGLREPLRLGQCSDIKLHLKKTVPMHVDGEPWEQDPGTITVTHSYQATVLVRN
ncbi:hypothetical protein Pmani_021367 [Petrolisthes manimaculis]|uniref:Diacylglycerol kinase n=1 Tax=Petrolisthes manimaculis TaxID=1843537 RepID=A0AAE1U1R8_9EUCA|nr:hypothetical protein Pmani_021367 [Petrolisthes manimaculis]